MSTSRARSALGSGLFLAVAPGIVAGLVVLGAVLYAVTRRRMAGSKC